MSKLEFIQECTMRNLQGMYSKGYWGDIRNGDYKDAYYIAVKTANLIYGENE